MSPARRYVAALLIGGLVVGTVACSDDDVSTSTKDRATTTASSPVATTIAPGDPATTAPSATDPTGTGGPDTADIWSAPGEPSPLQLGTGVAEPEYPAGQNGTVTTLADGSLDLLIQQVDEERGQVLANVVVLVVGDDATARARADGKLRPDEELPGNYYVSDPNPKLRAVDLADDVILKGEAKGQHIDQVTGRAAVAAALVDRLAEAPGIPYRVKVANGAINEIVVPDVQDATIPG